MSTSSSTTNVKSGTTCGNPQATATKSWPQLKLDTSPTAIRPVGLADQEGLYDTVEWGRRPTIEYHMRVVEERDRQYNSMFEKIKELANDKLLLQKDIGMVDAELFEMWKHVICLTTEAREKDKAINELRWDLKAARREMSALSEEYVTFAKNHDKVMKDHSNLRASLAGLAAEYGPTTSEEETLVNSSDDSNELGSAMAKLDLATSLA